MFLNFLETGDAEPQDAVTEDELSLLQSSTRVRGKHVTSAGSHHKLFCWTVITGKEQTIAEIQMQIQSCDGHVMLSQFSDSMRNIVQLYDDGMNDNQISGWRNNTMRLATAWAYVAQITE